MLDWFALHSTADVVVARLHPRRTAGQDDGLMWEVDLVSIADSVGAQVPMFPGLRPTQKAIDSDVVSSSLQKVQLADKACRITMHNEDGDVVLDSEGGEIRYIKLPQNSNQKQLAQTARVVLGDVAFEHHEALLRCYGRTVKVEIHREIEQGRPTEVTLLEDAPEVGDLVTLVDGSMGFVTGVDGDVLYLDDFGTKWTATTDEVVSWTTVVCADGQGLRDHILLAYAGAVEGASWSNLVVALSMAVADKVVPAPTAATTYISEAFIAWITDDSRDNGELVG